MASDNPLLTAYASPWQNGYVERLIGSIRRESGWDARGIYVRTGEERNSAHADRPNSSLHKPSIIPSSIHIATDTGLRSGSTVGLWFGWDIE